jgi:hypothetical protein
VGVENGSRGDTISFDHARNTSAKYDLSRNSDVLSRVSSSFASEDVPDAASEKDLVLSLSFSLSLSLSVCWHCGNRVWEVDLLGY